MRWHYVSIIFMLSAYATSLTHATKSDKFVNWKSLAGLESLPVTFSWSILYLQKKIALVATAFASFLQGLLLFRISEESDSERGLLWSLAFNDDKIIRICRKDFQDTASLHVDKCLAFCESLWDVVAPDYSFWSRLISVVLTACFEPRKLMTDSNVCMDDITTALPYTSLQSTAHQCRLVSLLLIKA